MIYGMILAGGSGTRMGNSDLPKQFLNIGDKPILIHTLEQFIVNKAIDKTIICVPEVWLNYARDLVNEHLGEVADLYFVVGGETRNETIVNGCKFISAEFGTKDADVIVTHDAVRPFINQRILEDNIAAIEQCEAVDTAVPAFDTIVASKDGVFISEVPLRSEMFQGQTPQTFKLNKFMELYASLSAEEKALLTDACKIFFLKCEKVKIVAGELSNIKITTLYDLKLANAIINSEVRND